MRCNAKRGIAIACRQSVWSLIRHIGWKSWKLIARTMRTTPSLFVAQRPSTYSQGNMGKVGRDSRWGGEKVACWSTNATISLKRVKVEEKLPWRAYRISPTFFRTVPSPTPTASSSREKIGGSQPHPKTQKSNRYYLRTGKDTDFKFGQHSERLWATNIQGVWLIIVRAIIFQDFQPRGPDPPTSQKDRQTDDMQSQDRALHHSASRGKNDLTVVLVLSTRLFCALGWCK